MTISSVVDFVFVVGDVWDCVVAAGIDDLAVAAEVAVLASSVVGKAVVAVVLQDAVVEEPSYDDAVVVVACEEVEVLPCADDDASCVVAEVDGGNDVAYDAVVGVAYGEAVSCVPVHVLE